MDVPGHERFVKNMLAGAHGIDAVLLVIAADESVMPQTREHFQICRLLGIPAGLIVLSKCDLADAEMQQVAEIEARELTVGSFLEAAPVLRVSAKSGEGIDALKAALRALHDRLGARPETGLTRLPIDRVFTMRGFGTVVTGTLVGGRISSGDDLVALPSGRQVRVRSVQTHGRAVDSLAAGQRAALNVAGPETQALLRGEVLIRPGTLEATSLVDVELTLLGAVSRPLRDQERMRVHFASAEVLARVRLLNGRRLEPGESAVAQLRLEAPAVAVRGDRLIVRSYSPSTTIGGARVLDPQPIKRRKLADAAGLLALAAASPREAALAYLLQAGERGSGVAQLSARVGVPAELLRAELAGADPIVLLDGGANALARAALLELSRRALARVARFHAESPLKAAMPREELRQQVFAKAPPGAAETALSALAKAGELRFAGDGVALAGRFVELKADEADAHAALARAFDEAGLAGLDTAEAVRVSRQPRPLVERLAPLLVEEGLLARVGDRLVARARLQALVEAVRARYPAGSALDVSSFKELTGLTRKHVIPLLEYLDRERVTQRAGAERFVRRAAQDMIADRGASS